MNKVLISLLLIISVVSLSGCFRKLDSGLILKTYKYTNEQKETGEIVLKEKTVTFIDVDFIDAFNVISQVSVAKELGAGINNISQSEINSKIEYNIDEYIYQSLLKNNTEYKYTYDVDNKTIIITSNDTDILIEFVLNKNKASLKFYNKEFK